MGVAALVLQEAAERELEAPRKLEVLQDLDQAFVARVAAHEAPPSPQLPAPAPDAEEGEGETPRAIPRLPGLPPRLQGGREPEASLEGR